MTGGVPGLTVTYHLSQASAIAGTNALPDTFQSVTKTIWTRVTNANGCFEYDLLHLVVLPSPGVVLQATDNTCTGANNGKVKATVITGPANYTYNWSNGFNFGPTDQKSHTIVNLEPGVYMLTLTDGNGCTAMQAAEVGEGTEFVLFPILDQGPFCLGEESDPIILTTNLWGATFSWKGGQSVGLPDGSANAFMPVIPAAVMTAPGVAQVTVKATLGLCQAERIYQLTVEDCNSPQFYSVAGRIATEFDMPVANVQATLIYTEPGMNGEMIDAHLTDANGMYAYEKWLTQGANYRLRPFADDDHGLNVSTADIIRLRRHLNGTQPLTSPYQLIAADINRSGSINLSDAHELHNLVLGIHTRFPYNTSWRFVDKAYMFPVPTNPSSKPSQRRLQLATCLPIASATTS